mgnify:FL=1
MKPVVSDNCISCGSCEAICPEVFKVESGKAQVLAADYQAQQEKIDEAISACPVQAISWEE